MATVSPVLKRTTDGIPYIVWEGIVTGDTLVGYPLTEAWGLASSVQISGTFGGATVKLQQSNDNSTYLDIKDVHGTTVSATAAAIFELSLSAAYLRPSIASGSANDIDVIMVLRGYDGS